MSGKAQRCKKSPRFLVPRFCKGVCPMRHGTRPSKTEREGERQRERESETETERKRQREREREREKERDREKERERERHRKTEGEREQVFRSTPTYTAHRPYGLTPHQKALDPQPEHPKAPKKPNTKPQSSKDPKIIKNPNTKPQSSKALNIIHLQERMPFTKTPPRLMLPVTGTPRLRS